MSKHLLLPMVESLVSSYNGPSLQNVKIIGAQHILETTHSMFRSLYKLGLKPENISLIGKCYSTCKEVYDEMVAEGIDVSSGSFAYSSHLSYDEQYTAEVRQFLSKRIHDLIDQRYDRVIVLDDGGKCIKFLSDHIASEKFMVAIEQTTAGYEAIRHLSLQFPVINVARSPVKLNLESPMIAQAAAERLYMSLHHRSLFPESALIIGGGAIGQAMIDKLSREMNVQLFDINKKLSFFKSSNLCEIIHKFPLIIGCTGKTSLGSELHSHLTKGTALVSVSSSDREFDAVHLRRQIAESTRCHEDLQINDILLINSGFPVNFDGARENIAPELIQLTIALITAGILNARALSSKKAAEIMPVKKTSENRILREFRKVKLQLLSNPN